MSIALVQAAYATSGGSTVTSQSCAYSQSVTAGDLLVVCASFNYNAPSGISDSLSNTWLTATSYTGVYPSGTIYYCIAASSGTDTVTATHSGSQQAGVSVSEWSAIAATSPLDVTAQSQAFASSVTVGPTGSAAAGDLALLYVAADANAASAGQPSTPSGWTLAYGANASTLTAQALALCYQILPTAGTVSASSASSGAGNILGQIVTFKAGAVGPTDPFPVGYPSSGPQNAVYRMRRPLDDDIRPYACLPHNLLRRR